MNLSLDDIILKKRAGFNNRSKEWSRSRRGTKEGRKAFSNNRDIPKRRRGNAGVVVDARLKIIEKNRQKLTDARDKLAELAKQNDARLKLDKLRERRKAASSVLKPGVQITKSLGLNGEIKLSTKKRQNESFKIKSNKRIERQVNQDFNGTKTSVIRRTVSNDMVMPSVSRSNIQQPSRLWLNTEHSSFTNTPALSARPNSLNSTSLKITARNPGNQGSMLSTVADRNCDDYFRNQARPGLEDSDDESISLWTSLGSASSRMSSDLKARLDMPSETTQSMGIFSRSSSLAPTGGYRIVVSNLQQSVTHEDIRELFEDVGPLVTSRLVRPGIAEVIYRDEKHAEKAVDVYHNRQLDGQPMKCMLVSSSSQPGRNTSRLFSSTTSSCSYKLPVGGKSSVVPDIATIHKALFNK